MPSLCKPSPLEPKPDNILPLSGQAKRPAGRVRAGDNDPFWRTKQTTARFFAERILPHAAALLGPVTSGAATLGALDDDQF